MSARAGSLLVALAGLSLASLASCTEHDPAGVAALVDSHETCAAIDICRPCDPGDFTIGPDGTNRCGFVLGFREVAQMGTAPIAYEGSDATSTWQVAGANPDGSPVIATTQLSGESAFTAIHAIAAWDDAYRSYDTDPPVGEWVAEQSIDPAFTHTPLSDVVIPAAGTSPGDPAMPIVRCGDASMTVEVTWPHEAQGPITDCDCDRILRETARRYAEANHLDRHVISVSSRSYAPPQYLRDDYAYGGGTAPREGLRANPPPKRRVIRATDGPNTPAIAQAASVYTITLHSAHPQTVKSDAKVFKADKAIIGFRAYDANRKTMVRTHTYFTQLGANAAAPKDTKGRIIHKVDSDVVIGSGPIAGVLASHLPAGAVVIDDGEKRHLHRNNTRIIQKPQDVSWERHLGPETPADFVEPRDMVGDGTLRHVHVGLASEQLFDKKKIVPGHITKIETVDGEVHLELKVDGLEDTFVIHVPKTKRVWVVTGPPETQPADYTLDDTAPAGDAAKLTLHGLDTKAKVQAFIASRVLTNNEWYDLPHDTLRDKVQGKHVFVFGTGGGGIQAIGQITDGQGGAGEVAAANKVTVAAFNGGIKAAGGDPATGPGGGQEAAYKALKKLAGIAEGATDWTPTTSNIIYGYKQEPEGSRQPPVVIDRVAVVFHDPGDGAGERPMLRITVKRPKPDKSEGLPDVTVYADEAIWTLPGPGKTELDLDAAVVKSFKLAMDGEVPLGATAVEGRLRFVAANATAGILSKLEDVKDVAPDAGTIAELKKTYQKRLEDLRGKAVNGAVVDLNSANEGTLLNQMRYVPLFAKWSPP
jgi:hypothetical protein